MMNGIVFFKQELSLIRNFYASLLALPVWLEQDSCVIFKANTIAWFLQAKVVNFAARLPSFLTIENKLIALIKS